MTNAKLEKYIAGERLRGTDDVKIKEALTGVGWENTEIDEALKNGLARGGNVTQNTLQNPGWKFTYYRPIKKTEVSITEEELNNFDREKKGAHSSNAGLYVLLVLLCLALLLLLLLTFSQELFGVDLVDSLL